MPDLTIEPTKQLPPSRLLLQARLPDAAEWIILPAVKTAAGRDDLIWREAERPVALPASPMKLIPKQADTTTEAPYDIPERFSAHPHGGINE